MKYISYIILGENVKILQNYSILAILQMNAILPDNSFSRCWKTRYEVAQNLAIESLKPPKHKSMASKVHL